MRVVKFLLPLVILSVALVGCDVGGLQPGPSLTEPLVLPTVTPLTIATIEALATPTPKLTPTAATTITHIVEAGDTLYELAKKYDTTIEAIVGANKLLDPDRLKIGQELIIPLPTPSP